MTQDPAHSVPASAGLRHRAARGERIVVLDPAGRPVMELVAERPSELRFVPLASGYAVARAGPDGSIGECAIEISSPPA